MCLAFSPIRLIDQEPTPEDHGKVRKSLLIVILVTTSVVVVIIIIIKLIRERHRRVSLPVARVGDPA